MITFLSQVICPVLDKFVSDSDWANHQTRQHIFCPHKTNLPANIPAGSSRSFLHAVQIMGYIDAICELTNQRFLDPARALERRSVAAEYTQKVASFALVRLHQPHEKFDQHCFANLATICASQFQPMHERHCPPSLWLIPINRLAGTNTVASDVWLLYYNLSPAAHLYAHDQVNLPRDFWMRGTSTEYMTLRACSFCAILCTDYCML
jgi:hypothetical protein